MTEFWEDWPKPWTVEQARKRYVLGPRIGLRALAVQSQISKKTLEDRSRFDGWVAAQRQFQDKTRARTGEKAAQTLADEIGTAENEHLRAWETLREIAMQFFNCLATTLEAIEQGKEPPADVPLRLDQLKQFGGKSPFTCYVNALRAAIAGEREALFMDYADPNILSTHADRLGYDLVERETGRQIFPQEPPTMV